MSRDIPFPGGGNGRAAAVAAIQKQLGEQLRHISCECGNERFAPSRDVLLVQDRLKPQICGAAEILEFSCTKCATVFVGGPNGFTKKPEAPPPDEKPAIVEGE